LERFRDYCKKNCFNRKLQLLDLGLGVNASEIICEILNRHENISKVNLLKNRLENDGACLLADSLTKSTTIVSVSLKNNAIGRRGGHALIECLRYNQSLVEFDIGSLDGLHRNKAGPIAMESLSEILRFNKTLTFLNVSGNSISNQGLEAICRGLKENNTLLTLGIA